MAKTDFIFRFSSINVITKTNAGVVPNPPIPKDRLSYERFENYGRRPVGRSVLGIFLSPARMRVLAKTGFPCVFRTKDPIDKRKRIAFRTRRRIVYVFRSAGSKNTRRGSVRRSAHGNFLSPDRTVFPL